MQQLYSHILQRLKDHQLDGIRQKEGMIFPHYGGFSLYNIPSSICHWLGVEEIYNSPSLDSILLNQPRSEFQHVIFLVVDGLGFQWFQRFLESPNDDLGGVDAWQRLMQTGSNFGVLTSVTPSTTTTALTTLWTGRLPAEHGILGYTMWLKEFGVVANMIALGVKSYAGDYGGLKKANFQPEVFLKTGSIGEHLSKHKVRVYSYLQKSIANSGLSQMHTPSAKVITYYNVTDMFVNLIDSIGQDPAHVKTLKMLYYSDIDGLSHIYGPQDIRVKREFESFSLSLEHTINTLKSVGKGDTLLLITADHGLIHTPKTKNSNFYYHPEFERNLIMPPTGENRFAYLHIYPGREKETLQYIDRNWPEEFDLYPSTEVLESGLFGNGKTDPRVNDRIGSWIAISNQDHHWWWEGKEDPLLGRHGGLSEEEMLVPFLSFMI